VEATWRQPHPEPDLTLAAGGCLRSSAAPSSSCSSTARSCWWIFFISIPLGLAALALSPLLVEAPDADWGSLQTILLVAGSVAVGATVAQAVVLKAGFRAVAATGMALLLLGRLRRTPRERLEAVPVPVSND
jgi:hypothetical protein